MSMITPDDLAQLCQVRRPTVLRWHRAGLLPPAIRVNDRVLRWPAETIAEWMRQAQQPIERRTPETTQTSKEDTR